MLKALFPKSHARYLTLPVLGTIADGYCGWLFEQGYRRGCLRLYMYTLTRLDQALQQRGRYQLAELTRDELYACRPRYSQEDRNLGAILTTLTRYLDEQQLLAPSPPKALGRSETQVAA